MEKVYLKSEKAIAEFKDGNRTLSLRHRQVLLMADGKRTSAELANMLGNMNAQQMMLDLEKLGYLVDQKSALTEQNLTTKSADSDKNSQRELVDTITKEHVEFIKSFMVDELEIQIGLMMGRTLLEKIKNVKENAELKTCIARWHMAIRDSKNGRTVADALMGKLHHLIANPPSEAPSTVAS